MLAVLWRLKALFHAVFASAAKIYINGAARVCLSLPAFLTRAVIDAAIETRVLAFRDLPPLAAAQVQEPLLRVSLLTALWAGSRTSLACFRSDTTLFGRVRIAFSSCHSRLSPCSFSAGALLPHAS